MIDHRNIRQKFRTQLLTVTTLPAKEKRAWENRGFTPPNPPSLYVDEALIPISETLPATNTLEFVGVMQYRVYTPGNKGTEDAEDLIKAIGDKFKPASTVASIISIDETRRMEGRYTEDNAWYFIALRILFRSYTTNT